MNHLIDGRPGAMPIEEIDEMSETTTTTIGTTTETVAPDAQQLVTELQQAREALKAANREAAQRRIKLDEYEKAEQTRKESELSEMDKLNRRLAEAEQQRQQALQTANDRLIKAAFVAEAAKHGVEYPEDAFLLADKSNVAVDDSGNVTGVAETVKTLVDGKRLPLRNRAVASLDAGAGSTGGGQRSTALNEAELAIARRLGIKPEDYAANKRRE